MGREFIEGEEGLTAIGRRAIEQRAFAFRTFAGKPPCLFD
jgi:hypothetical protein